MEEDNEDEVVYNAALALRPPEQPAGPSASPIDAPVGAPMDVAGDWEEYVEEDWNRAAMIQALGLAESQQRNAAVLNVGVARATAGAPAGVPARISIELQMRYDRGIAAIGQAQPLHYTGEALMALARAAETRAAETHDGGSSGGCVQQSRTPPSYRGSSIPLRPLGTHLPALPSHLKESHACLFRQFRMAFRQFRRVSRQFRQFRQLFRQFRVAFRQFRRVFRQFRMVFRQLWRQM
jgi:hypothetical protein